MLADHLARIHLFSRLYEEFASILQLVQGIRIRLACFHRNQGAGMATRELAFPRLELHKTMGDNGLTFGCRQ